jgi:hypothetical protein
MCDTVEMMKLMTTRWNVETEMKRGGRGKRDADVEIVQPCGSKSDASWTKEL